ATAANFLWLAIRYNSRNAIAKANVAKTAPRTLASRDKASKAPMQAPGKAPTFKRMPTGTSAVPWRAWTKVPTNALGKNISKDVPSATGRLVPKISISAGTANRPPPIPNPADQAPIKKPSNSDTGTVNQRLEIKYDGNNAPPCVGSAPIIPSPSFATVTSK